jgi:predicted  nucleic acid-binding Zn-ribbon protein
MSTPVPIILKELHRLRKHLRDLQSEIDLGPRVMKAQQAKLVTEEAAHKEAYETLKRLKIKQKEDEGSLKATEQQLGKFEAQIHSAGSAKEFGAKQQEITYARKQKGELEDAILATMNEIEERTTNIPNVEKRWADAQREFEQYKIDANERLERLRADQTASQAELTATETKLPPEVKERYDRLVKSYGPEALAAVNGRSCQHCRRSITEQQRNDLVRGEFICCSQCGRGLYLAEGT